MKRTLDAVALLLGGLSAGLYWHNAPVAVNPASAEPRASGAANTSADTPLPPPPVVPTKIPPTASPSAPLLKGDAAETMLRDAAASRDAALLPVLKRYLSHADPDIRSAAREAIIQLGEPGGVAVLQDAAAQSPDPEEARALRQAAELLALPSWSSRAR